MSPIDRAGALAGVAGSLLVFVFVTLAEPAGDRGGPVIRLVRVATARHSAQRFGSRWLVLEAGVTFAASEPESYGTDAQLAKLFTLWSWNAANLLAPAFAALVGGATVVGFSTTTFPSWFRWTGVALLALMLLIVAVPRAPGSRLRQERSGSSLPLSSLQPITLPPVEHARAP